MAVTEVSLYVCPSPGCGNYYGSSSMPELSERLNRRTSMRNRGDESPENWGAITGTRAECPDCRDRGEKVERVLTVTRILVPDAAPTPAA